MTGALEGRVALVTGAGRGLGAACAEALAEAGAEVVLMARTAGEIEAMARRIGPKARTLCCDVLDTAAMQAAIGGLDRLDILVNNAGTNIPEPFVEVSEEHFDRIVDLNVRAAFLVAQAAVRKMLEARDRKQRGGAVVNMSSQMGHVGSPNRTVYCLSKHALEGLTKAMAVELAPQNIRVNSVGPTFVDTPLTRPMFENPVFRDFVFASIPLGRLGTPAEIAAAVVFLASPASSLITGASLLADGGWTAR